MILNKNIHKFISNDITYNYSWATLDDVDKILLLEELIFEPMFRTNRINIRKAILSQHGFILLIYNELMHTIGYIEAVILPLHRRMHINSLGVLPSYRNKGIAHSIFKIIENYAKKRNVDQIRLEVSTNNQDAINLYKNLEFNESYTYKDYYATGIDAFRMIKTLNFQNQSHVK